MDEINDFFNFSKPFKREIISGGYVDGRTVKPDAGDGPPVKREHLGTEYVDEYRCREHANLTQAFITEHHAKSSATIKPEPRHGDAASSSHLNDLESESGTDFLPPEPDDADDGKPGSGSRHCKSDPTSVYERYPFHYVEPNLPIVAWRQHILQTIDASPVTVLQGSTGCGKSTQLPQFILDQARERGEHCNIVVTQPRRIAARSICMRVCGERKWECGSLVGFQVGLSTHSSEDTRLLFCTTGVLLEKLVHSRSLAAYTHLVLDEVHERDQDMDFLFIVVRRLLAVSPHCKIVLMSATIEAEQFAEYFRIGERAAPVLRVDSARPFVVREFYLCDLVKLNIVRANREMISMKSSLVIQHMNPPPVPSRVERRNPSRESHHRAGNVRGHPQAGDRHAAHRQPGQSGAAEDGRTAATDDPHLSARHSRDRSDVQAARGGRGAREVSADAVALVDHVRGAAARLPAGRRRRAQDRAHDEHCGELRYDTGREIRYGHFGVRGGWGHLSTVH